MSYTIVKRVNGVSLLVLNDFGFPFLFNNETDAVLEKIEQQQKYDEPILVYKTTITV